MSKAEEATNDFCTRCFKYGKCHKVQSECTTADSYQEGYEDGYHQAEKDLELTWEDIKIILDIENDVLRECNSQKELVLKIYPKGEDYYGEILKRYKERKEK